jgi:hypothetical protein
MFSPRRWMGFLFGWHDATLVEQLANEIALRCHPEVYDRINRKYHGMDRSMLKGYVRAHAAAVIAEEVDAAATASDAVARLRRELTAAVRERLVYQVVEDLLHAAAAPSRMSAAA